MPLYVKLFNKVLLAGQMPEDCLISIIIPIYTKKRAENDVNNYRGVTLLSCLGKLFTSLLNERLFRFCETNGITKELQAGFRKGYSTLHYIFLLKGLVDLMRFVNSIWHEIKYFVMSVYYVLSFCEDSRYLATGVVLGVFSHTSFHYNKPLH